jgi:hypothetical protein
MSMKSVAVIATVMSIFAAPAFADDAAKASVLRDLGQSTAQDVQPSDANALAVSPAPRAQRPAQVLRRPSQVIVNSPTPFDYSHIGHN